MVRKTQGNPHSSCCIIYKWHEFSRTARNRANFHAASCQQHQHRRELPLHFRPFYQFFITLSAGWAKPFLYSLYTTLTTVITLVNDIIDALDCKKNTMPLFLLTSWSALDIADHVILTDKLHSTGLSGQAVRRLSNYLPGRTRCVQSTVFFPPFIKRYTPGLCPRTIAFYLFESFWSFVRCCFHFHADDTVFFYCSSPSVVQTLEFLQFAFDVQPYPT